MPIRGAHLQSESAALSPLRRTMVLDNVMLQLLGSAAELFLK
jgi:hypothetical protein